MRTIVLKNLQPNKTYAIREAPSGKIVRKISGKNLMEIGIQIKIESSYDGKIFEVGVN